MTKRLVPALAVVALCSCVGVVVAMAQEAPIYLSPSISLAFNAHFAPKKLPKSKRAGISLRIDSKVRMGDDSQPPALEEMHLEFDRNFAIDAKGLPVCHSLRLQVYGVPSAEQICKKALVGVGKAEFEIAFPEQAPFPVGSKVLAFNAGVSGGKSKLLLHTYLGAPVSAAVVIPVEVSKESRGVFALEATAKVPKIAGGYGSVTSLALKLGREFTYRGQPKDYLLAKCPRGQLLARLTDTFRNGARLEGLVMRTCVPKDD